MAFQVRSLGTQDLAAARALVREQGLQTLYLGNQIEEEERTGSCAGRLYGVFSEAGLVQVAFFGNRGQSTATQGPPGADGVLADLALGRELGWRMFVGPRAVGEAFVRGAPEKLEVQLDRPQPFLAVTEKAKIPRDWAAGRSELRKATHADVERLCDACLELNREDLGVQPASVDRRVLRRHLWARIEMDRTWVIGPPGRFLCKLDLGSVGPAGVMVEGVFTFPAHRGKGLARRIVALVASRYLRKYPAVCLHLGAGNRAARRAYEAAGMHEVAELRLVLASPPAG